LQKLATYGPAKTSAQIYFNKDQIRDFSRIVRIWVNRNGLVTKNWQLLSCSLSACVVVSHQLVAYCAGLQMNGQLHSRVSYVIGPDGSPLTIADLPPPGTRRWVIRRKAEVVAAVRGGLLSLEEACSRYTLTVEEYLSWQRSIDRHGLAGLRTTRIQQYRG
jgi:hypothetical protein